MNHLSFFYTLILVVQLLHSVEELSTGFHKKWYLFKMPFSTFLLFELLFSSFWILVLLIQDFPYRTLLQAFFLVLMFANGVQHIVWWGSVKKYVPGLINAFNLAMDLKLKYAFFLLDSEYVLKEVRGNIQNRAKGGRRYVSNNVNILNNSNGFQMFIVKIRFHITVISRNKSFKPIPCFWLF
jgi:hypothetical protein